MGSACEAPARPRFHRIMPASLGTIAVSTAVYRLTDVRTESGGGLFADYHPLHRAWVLIDAPRQQFQLLYSPFQSAW
jgi:hypothetical protein